MKRLAPLTSFLGVLSAFFASICCVGPLLLVLLGLGGVWMASSFAKYHWVFNSLALLILSYAWIRFFKERKACCEHGCEMQNRKLKKGILLSSTFLILFFSASNLYSSFFVSLFPSQIPQENSLGATQIEIKVNGMSCFTCEIALKKALKGLKGIVWVKPSAAENKVVILYHEEELNLATIFQKIKEVGYEPVSTQPL